MSDAAWDRIKQSIDNLRRGEMGTKTCSRCHACLPLSKFTRRSDRDGRLSHCKACVSEYNREYHRKRKAQPVDWTPNLPPPPPCPASRLLREWPKGADTGPVTWRIAA